MDVIITFLFYFVIFALIHSLLAADYIKNKARKLFGKGFRWYRLLYTAISFITFAPALLIWLKYTSSTPLVYLILQWLYPVIILIRLLALGLFLSAALKIDMLEFIGIKPEKIQNVLIRTGAYGIVRHPLYTAGIIILFTKMDMTLLDLTAALLVSIYLIVGAYIEEKRLIFTLGEEYRKYQQQVSMFIPVKWVMKTHSTIFL